MVMSKGAVLDLAHEYFPSARRTYAQAEFLDTWGKGQQSSHESGKLFVPSRGQAASDEYNDLGERSYTPWLSLIVTALVQTMFVEGAQIPDNDGKLECWTAWRRNGWNAKQSILYRDALTHGTAFGLVLPGEDRLTGKNLPQMLGVSARKMAAFFAEDDDEYPMFAIRAERYYTRTEDGWLVKLYDEEAVYQIRCIGDGEARTDWFFVDYDLHDFGVTPVVEYSNLKDLDGRTSGEIEPLIPIAKRIDQDTFDRLIVQRFGAWKVRYMTGLVKPPNLTEEQHAAGLLKLKVSDFLTLEGENARVGTLDETQLDGFIAARDSDIRDLAAVSQTPPHHMLGLSSNMAPESLAAVNANLMAKAVERKTSFEESHQRFLRLTAMAMGNRIEAESWDMDIRWRDMESRSFAQAADALGKLATQLKVPVEMLWKRIPDWSDFDTQEAKRLIEDGAIDALLAGLEQQGVLAADQGTPTKPVKV